MYGIIYKITCLVNGKIYIGMTKKTAEKRLKEHIKCSKRENRKYNSHLYEAINRYGKDSFKIEIIDTCDSLDEMCEREKYWILTLNSTNHEIGMNIHKGGLGGKPQEEKKELTKKQLECLSIGWHMPMSEENKKLVSSIHKGKIVSQETREKLRKAQTGKKASEDTRIKMSEQRKGKKLPERSEESKKRYRECSLNRVHIHKNGINKNVKIDDIDSYLSDGWERGYSSNK